MTTTRAGGAVAWSWRRSARSQLRPRLSALTARRSPGSAGSTWSCERTRAGEGTWWGVIVEGEAQAPGDVLELVVFDRQGVQLAQAGDELLFKPIDDGHATPQGRGQRDGDFAHLWPRSRDHIQ
jgi:hypothetical protein